MWRFGVVGYVGQIIEGGLNARQLGTAARYDANAIRPEVQGMADAGKTIPSAYRRVVNQLATALKVHPQASVNEHAKQMMKARRSKGDRMYGIAYKNEKPFSIKQSVVDLVNEAQDRGPEERAILIKTAANFFDVDGAGKPTRMLGTNPGDLKKFQARKETLDDAIGKAQRKGLNNRVRMLTDFKNSMLKAIDNSNDHYKRARDYYSGDISMQNAMEAGRLALNDRVDIGVNDFAALSAAEKRFFQFGFFDKARASLGGNEAGDKTLLFREDRTKEILNAIIPDDTRSWFNKVNELEGRMKQTDYAVRGNSKTAERLADDAKQNVETAIGFGAKMARGDLMGAAVEAARKVAGRFFGFRADVAENLAKMLTTMDKPALMELANRLDRQTRSRRGTNMVKTYLNSVSGKNAGAIGGVIGGQNARPAPQPIP